MCSEDCVDQAVEGLVKGIDVLKLEWYSETVDALELLSMPCHDEEVGWTSDSAPSMSISAGERSSIPHGA
jgi:hypothetical protein